MGLENARLSSTRMTSRPFIIPAAKGKSFKTIDAIDVAARYFVYKLFDATAGQPMQWTILQGIDESRATIARAVERGWVLLEGTSSKPLERKAALTDEGRRLARKGRWDETAHVPHGYVGDFQDGETRLTGWADVVAHCA